MNVIEIERLTEPMACSNLFTAHALRAVLVGAKAVENEVCNGGSVTGGYDSEKLFDGTYKRFAGLASSFARAVQAVAESGAKVPDAAKSDFSLALKDQSYCLDQMLTQTAVDGLRSSSPEGIELIRDAMDAQMETFRAVTALEKLRRLSL